MFLHNVHKGQNEFWQYLLTIMGVIVAYIMGQLPLFFVAMAKAPSAPEAQRRITKFSENIDFAVLDISTNLGLVLMLLIFVFAMMALWGFVVHLHKRPFRTLITPQSRIDWSKVAFGFFLWGGMTLICEAVAYWLHPEAYIWQFEIQNFLPLLLIALFLIPIQTTFEEVFFRGYLMQGISLINESRLAPLLITSVLFGAIHFSNPEVTKFGAGLMMTYYIGVGLFLGIITLLYDSLELAIGVHAATNIFATVFITFDGSALQTDALFKTTEFNVLLSLGFTLIMALIFLLVCRKKYGPGDWKKVFGLVENNEPLEDIV
ncbi:MAG: CPBP family intramembrane glutamic endopeptidase [Bacteroidota bacterium]